MDRESSNTCGMLDTPFLLRATHRYCLMADMNTSSVRKTGPEFCRMESKSSRERIFERSSCDLREVVHKKNRGLQLTAQLYQLTALQYQNRKTEVQDNTNISCNHSSTTDLQTKTRIQFLDMAPKQAETG